MEGAAPSGPGGISPDDDVPTSGHFMAYMVTSMVVVVIGYLIYHNKQRVLAYLLEGRSGRTGQRRRVAGKEYSRLKNNVDEALPSLDKPASNQNIIY
jgi:hypothetical protein